MLEIKTYITMPDAVRGTRVTEENIEEVCAWVEEKIGRIDYSDVSTSGGGIAVNPENGEIFIASSYATTGMSVGDYVAYDENGDFFCCKPDIFEATYDRVIS